MRKIDKNKLAICKRLKEARIKAGLTRQELAEILGTKSDNIQKIENTKHGHIPNNLKEWAEACGVSAPWVMFGIEDLEKLDQKSIDIAIQLSRLSSDERDIVVSTINALLKK